jgi:hypothetical protein
VFQDGSGRPSKLKRRRPEDNAVRAHLHIANSPAEEGDRAGPGASHSRGRLRRGGRLPKRRVDSFLSSYRRTPGPDTRGHARRTAQAPPGALGRRPTDRDVLPGEKCVTPAPRSSAPAGWRPRTVGRPTAAKTPSLLAGAARRAARPESPLSHFREPPVYSQTVSRTLELSLQSSFQLSLTVLVRYRSRGRIQS